MFIILAIIGILFFMGGGKTVLNNFKLSKDFNLTEFQVHDGSGLVKVDDVLVQKLQKLRDIVGKPVTIVSGYRTPEYNAKVGGAEHSQHMLGKAADIKVEGIAPIDLAKIAEKIGFGGVGIYKTWLHVDVRDGIARWNG